MDIDYIIMVIGSVVAIFKGITSSLKDISDIRTNKKKQPTSKPSTKRKK